MSTQEEFIARFSAWAKNNPLILTAILVGSHAHGTARPDSDIDLVIVTDKQEELLSDESWTEMFGKLKHVVKEDFGLVQSKRVYYQDGLEVEFGITSPVWLKTDPVDPGTARVMGDGHRILVDKTGLAAAFLCPTF